MHKTRTDGLPNVERQPKTLVLEMVRSWAGREFRDAGPEKDADNVCLCLCFSPESAPLSSSLIDDWRYVTGDIDARDLEATLQEMGAPHISLTDLTSARLLSP